ncbi:MAG: hypothetical protein SPK64_03695 [Candidatus Enterosoma sp.]|nr:hypothetical protein [Bacilli bacterium]MDD7607123.1 hypothetical protein [bacterium]MDY3907051.1 hypothetical protein [Candidatus Enterosoma sp.]MDY5650127.1 hypothetical protein [Candidatus Enterosoma sp.]MDY5866043.1 hypothetical protein [Candidatus Enterosoma sp.]
MKTYKDIISIDYFKRDPEKIDKMDSYHFDIDEKNINMIKNDTEVNKCQKKDVQKEISSLFSIAKKIEKENMQDMFCLFDKEDLSLKLALKLTYKDKRYTFYQGYKPFTQMFYQDILENMNSIIKKNK